jgi:nucleoid-associated protein YgaU
MATKITHQLCDLQREALKRKKLARPGFAGIATRAPNPFSEQARRVLAWMVQGSIEDTQAVFFQEKIVGHATVGNDELRCTGRADEITIPVKTRQVEVVACGPAD